MDNPIYVIIIVLITSAYIAASLTIGDYLASRPRKQKDPGLTYLFGRAYYSKATEDWLGHGSGHARRMTGIERANYGC